MREKKSEPQRLKPGLFQLLFGTTRSRALPKAHEDRHSCSLARTDGGPPYGCLLSSAMTLWINSFASVRLFITIWMSSTGLAGQRWLWQ